MTNTNGKIKGPFTDSEREFLREKAAYLTPKDIAAQLHRATVAVSGEMNRLGLIKKKKQKKARKARQDAPIVELDTPPLDPEIAALNSAYLALKQEMPDNVKRALLWLADRLGVKITVQS